MPLLGRLLAVLCFVLTPSILLAQSTTVSGTITDAAGQAWIAGTYSFVFKVSPSNPTGPYFFNGAPFSTAQTIAAALDASGHYSASVPPNTSIVPSGSLWTATFCPLASSKCFTQDFTITGASQTVQPVPPAISVDLISPQPGPQRAYSDTEISNAAIGSIYYNTTSTSYRSCIAVSGQTCLTWQNIAGGGGSGNCSVQGNPGDLQKNAVGACAASSINDLNGVVNIANPTNVNADATFKGPNPKVYATAYSVRGVNTLVAPAIPGYTGNCTATNTTLPVSSSTGFVNGDGIVVYGCGATNTMSTPSAPTVTPSVAAAMTGTLIDAHAPTGATSFSYKIVARDLNGGLTAASAATSITTGNPLGVQTINITSATMTNQLVTVTTSSAHGLVVGALVVMAGTATAAGPAPPNPFNGTFIVNGSADNTHFTYYTNYDTRSGALPSVTGGTVTYWNSNQLHWTAVTGATQYYIYGRTSGSWNLIGVSIPYSSTLASDITGGLFWDDFGSTMTTAPNLPSYVPSSAPASATNDMLITTIVSGAGTTSLVLALAPSQTISTQTILFDNSLNFVTAANAAVSSNSDLYVSTGSGYIFNAPATLPARLEMELHGNLYLNETMTLSRSDELWGLPASNVALPSFAFKPSVSITVANANPGLLGVGSNYFHWLTVTPTGNNANLLYFGDIIPNSGDIPGSSFEYMNFQTANGGTDYMSLAMMFRSDHTTLSGGEFPVFLHYVLFLASQNGANTSFTPIYYASYSGGNFEADHVFLSGKGIFVRVPDTGGYTDINWVYSQGNYEPFFNIYRSTGGNSAYTFRSLSNVTFDTTTQPLVANLGSGAPGSQTVTLFTSGVSLLPSQLTGNPATNNGNVNDAIYGQDSAYPSSFNQNTIAVGPGFSFLTSYAPAPAPSCVVSAGGSVPVSATLAYTVVPVWANGSEGTPSLYCSAPTTTGNQTVTVSWSAPPGNATPISYDVYRQGSSGSGVALANLGQHIQSPYVDTFGFTNSSTVPTVAAGGPGGLQNELHWGSAYAIETRASAPTAFAGVNLFDLAGDNWPAFNVNGNVNKYFLASWLSTTVPVNNDCVNWVVSGGIKTLGDAGASCGSGSGGFPNPMTTLGDMIVENSVPTPARLPGPTAPNGVPQFLLDTPSAGAAQLEFWGLAGVPVNNNSETTCATYTLNVLDRATNIECSGGTTATITIPAHTGVGFGGNFPVDATNFNSGILTLTTTSPDTIDGGAAGGSQTVLSNWDAHLRQDASGNWHTIRVPTQQGFNSNTNCGDATHALSFSTTTGIGCQSLSSTALTVQTNSVNNSSQTTINLLNSAAFNGLTFTFTNTSAGNVQAGFTGTLGNGGLTNSTIPINGTTCTLGTACTPPPNNCGFVDLTNSTVTTLQTICTTPTAGHYLLSYYMNVNSSCPTGSDVWTLLFQWVDASGTTRALQTGNLNVTTSQLASSYLEGTFSVWVGSGNVTVTPQHLGSCATGSSSYDFHTTGTGKLR